MEPHHFFTAQRTLIVAGKGGVGKSTVAAALAVLSARSGLRTMLVTLDAESIEVPAHELLERVTVTPGRALGDYLSSKGMGLLSRQLARSGIVELVATTAPGLDDLLVLGRIKAFERELRADVIIVDGPPAGHAVDLVRAPIQLKRAIATGPIGQQADEVLDMLADPARCRIVMVTTPGVTPVTETVEVARDIVESVHSALTPVFVNRVDARVPVLDTAALPAHLADAVANARERAASQHDAIALLQESLDTGRIELPRHRLVGVDLIDRVADDIALAVRGIE